MCSRNCGRGECTPIRLFTAIIRRSLTRISTFSASGYQHYICVFKFLLWRYANDVDLDFALSRASALAPLYSKATLSSRLLSFARWPHTLLDRLIFKASISVRIRIHISSKSLHSQLIHTLTQAPHLLQMTNHLHPANIYATTVLIRHIWYSCIGITAQVLS